MIKTFSTAAGVAIGAAVLVLSAAGTGHAQQPVDSDPVEVREEVVVTGSYIRKKDFTSPSPVDVTTAQDIDDSGFATLTDLVKYIPGNTGSEFNPDLFTQVFSAGTAQFNLRGLGLASTLVLVDGKRQTLSTNSANDGSTFVDVNSLMPLIAVDRIETLKDGAAATYGSDAVAGVVNFITRKDYHGLLLDVQGSDVTEGSQHDLLISMLTGYQADNAHIVAAFSYLDRGSLLFPEREFTEGTGLSALGQPGSLLPLARPTIPPFGMLFDLAGPGVPIKDPGCGTVPGSLNADPTSPFGTCGLDFSRFFKLVPKEQRFKGFADAAIDLGDNTELFAQFYISDNKAETAQTPSTPLIIFPIVPPNNPGNFLGVPSVFVGRPFGASIQGEFFPPDQEPVFNTNRTWRLSGGARGDLPMFNSWTWEAAATFSRNDAGILFGDTLKNELQLAISGFGGDNCNPATDLPGVGSCEFFDPSLAGQFRNSDEVNDFIQHTSTFDGSSELLTIDLIATGDLPVELPGGIVGVAVGGQYRDARLNGDWGDQYNAFNLAFLDGGSDFGGSQDVWAGFIELALPVHETLDVQLALRHENYGSGVDSTDPKVAILWRPLETLAIRGSFSTSFRGPSVFQTDGAITTVEEIFDLDGTRVFRPVRSVGNPDLQPEQADVFNVGASWEFIDDVTVSIDYWRFDFSDVITRENAQSLVDASDPRVVRDPLTGQIVRIFGDFINAAAIETDGIDFNFEASREVGRAGIVRLDNETTYIASYDLQQTPDGPVIDGAGSRNFTNFARPVPEWRSNTFLSWLYRNHSANVALRHIASYDDDQNPGSKIGSHTTVDIQYNYQLPVGPGDNDGPLVTLGVTNVFNNLPPFVNTSGGFDPKTHDPRGRVVYFAVRQEFN